MDTKRPYVKGRAPCRNSGSHGVFVHITLMHCANLIDVPMSVQSVTIASEGNPQTTWYDSRNIPITHPYGVHKFLTFLNNYRDFRPSSVDWRDGIPVPVFFGRGCATMFLGYSSTGADLLYPGVR
jgi:hypothetical protein